MHGFNEHTVVSVVPPVFASYARIFHPAKDVDGEPVRWAEVAAANGTTTAHPVMDWGSVAGGWRTPGQPRLWHEAPEHGSLPPRTARAVAGVLRRFTHTPDCAGPPLGRIRPHHRTRNLPTAADARP